MVKDITTRKIQQLLAKNGIDVFEITPLYAGFNRKSFSINNEYVLKICVDTNNEFKIKNEIEFYKKNGGNGFFPRLIAYDDSKSVIPFIYTIEEKIQGTLLFDLWENMNNSQRIDILNQLLAILKSIHKPVEYKGDYADIVLDIYNKNLENCIEKNIFKKEEINYLENLKKIIINSFDDVKMGYIHGDIHFNNIIVNDSGIKLIDFECYKKAPIDLEFDSLNRMIRNPKSFVKNGESGIYYDPREYLMVMDFFKQAYPSICQREGFDDRLIIYDILNATRWISIFPEHQLYREVLFSDTKSLKLK